MVSREFSQLILAHVPGYIRWRRDFSRRDFQLIRAKSAVRNWRAATSTANHSRYSGRKSVENLRFSLSTLPILDRRDFLGVFAKIGR